MAINDRLVWGIDAGDALVAAGTLRIDDEPDGKPVFTEGREYRVVSVHPIATPAFVRVIDDQGVSHTLEGSHILKWFRSGGRG